jgi:signal peptidase complex subunit 3
MHSSWVRIQNVFGFFTSVAFAVAAAIAVSVFLSPQSPSASLQLQNIQVYVHPPNSLPD